MIDHQIDWGFALTVLKHMAYRPEKMEWLYCWTQSYGIVLNTVLIKPIIKIVKQLVMICGSHVSNFSCHLSIRFLTNQPDIKVSLGKQ